MKLAVSDGRGWSKNRRAACTTCDTPKRSEHSEFAYISIAELVNDCGQTRGRLQTVAATAELVSASLPASSRWPRIAVDVKAERGQRKPVQGSGTKIR